MRLNMRRLRGASTIAAVALVLTACSGGDSGPGDESAAGEDGGTYTGRLVGAEGTLLIGDVDAAPEAVTVECSDEGDVITATLTEPESGNTVTTTQPESGEGYAAATLTTSDSTYEFVPRDGVTSDDVEKLATESFRDVPPIFEDEDQYGSPIEWSADGTADFYFGLNYEPDGGSSISVDIPGGVLDCSGSSEQ